MNLRKLFAANRFLWIALGITLAVRVAYLLLRFLTTDLISSDAAYYVAVAQDPMRLIYAPHRPVVAIGPIYPVFLMPFFLIAPNSAPLTQLVWARAGHIILDTLTAACIYLIAQRVFGERVARTALIVQAFDPRYILQIGPIGTETLFITLMAMFMLAYLIAVEQGSSTQWLGRYRGAGVLLGAAVLTRPVPMLYPAVLIVHAWLQANRRKALRGAAALTVAMGLMLVPWTVRGWINTGSIMPVSSTGVAHLWQATREDADDLGGDSLEQAAVEDASASEGQSVESIAEVEQGDYVTAALKNILQAPMRWISRIAVDLVKSYVQPYGTTLLPSTPISFKSLFVDVIGGRAPVMDLITLPGFVGRILIYLWHYWGLAFGVIGAGLGWKNRRVESFPLIGWILYNSALLSMMLVEPRYLFPLMFAFTIFAAYATVTVWDAIKKLAPNRLAAAGGNA